jgi:hypothetical protein
MFFQLKKVLNVLKNLSEKSSMPIMVKKIEDTQLTIQFQALALIQISLQVNKILIWLRDGWATGSN